MSRCICCRYGSSRDKQNLTPGYQQKAFPPEAKLARWCLMELLAIPLSTIKLCKWLVMLASPDAAQDSLLIHQDARVSVARLDDAETLDYLIAAERKVYLHVARGSLQANGNALSAGDALKYTDEAVVELSAAKDAEVLLFDMR